MQKFKVGDKIHIPDIDVCSNCKGLDVIIYKVYNKKYYFFINGEYQSSENNMAGNWCYEPKNKIDEHCTLVQSTIKFKVGDEVKILGKSVGQEASPEIIGQIEKIKEFYGDGSGRDTENCILISSFSDGSNFFAPQDLELVKNNKGNEKLRGTSPDMIIHDELIPKKMKELKEKFILALTKEPKKSFRKVGITDGDDILTEEGSQVFLTWLLLNKHADEFKKDVVDPMLKKTSKEKEEETEEKIEE